jgi:hypothetical protein
MDDVNHLEDVMHLLKWIDLAGQARPTNRSSQVSHNLIINQEQVQANRLLVLENV